MIVCKCRKIDLEELKTLIKNKDIRDLNTLLQCSFAGNGCRSCIAKEFDKKNLRDIYLTDIIKDSK